MNITAKGNADTGYSPYFLFYVRVQRLLTDVDFGFLKDNQKLLPSKLHYVEQHMGRYRYGHQRAQMLASKQKERNKGLYD